MAIKTEELALPSFGPTPSDELSDYEVKYFKANVDEPVERAELSIIETKGLKGTDVVILSKDKFTFMDKYFVIVQYMEKRNGRPQEAE
jgi:hypothetical protein